jgi:phospholipid transport system substrate-binding protein
MLREVANCMFAWEEMSKRSMGTYWRERTPEERNEFIKLFSDLLENTYMTKIESYSGEKILYSNESIEGQYAMVQTKIILRQGVEVPVNYFMIEKNGSWVVYDVSIEGISIVKNYRSQINDILSRSSYPELIKKLKEKQVASQVPAV